MPLNSLILTVIVGLVVMYEYAIIGFYFFRKDYNGSCNSMLDCTTTTIYQGLRMDIGHAIAPISVDDEMHWYKRIGFDLSFFIVITTILMNVIFGIIVDAFGSLRDETHDREQHMQSNTFISCIDRVEADRAGYVTNIGSGFEFLDKVKQNRWSYFNFIFYLRRKEPTEYTGLETRVAGFVDDLNVSWMPLTVCKLMESLERDSEMMKFQAEVGQEMRMMRQEMKMMASTLASMEGDLATTRQIVGDQAGGDEMIQKKLSKERRLSAMSPSGSKKRLSV